MTEANATETEINTINADPPSDPNAAAVIWNATLRIVKNKAAFTIFTFNVNYQNGTSFQVSFRQKKVSSGMPGLTEKRLT